MTRKVYISFKTEDLKYKEAIQELDNLDYIDKSLNEPVNSVDEDYIMTVIRQDYLYDSTVTIFLIGDRSSESLGAFEQRFIKRELQASLYNSSLHNKNGILGIVLPSMYSSVYGDTYTCSNCGGVHSNVAIGDSTAIKEFSYNFYIPNDKCAHGEDDRYCILVRWDDFIAAPDVYIEQAFTKRTDAIAGKTRVRPL
jgi:hypothetical protein